MDYLEYSIETMQIESHKLAEHMRKLELLLQAHPENKVSIQQDMDITARKISDLLEGIKLLGKALKREGDTSRFLKV